MFNGKQAIGRWYIFPHHLISASALPGTVQNYKPGNHIFSLQCCVLRCKTSTSHCLISSILFMLNIIIFMVMYNSLDFVINGVHLHAVEGGA